jgi:hypothetical protein
VAAGVVGERGCARVELGRVAEVELVRVVTMAEPELLRTLGRPGQRALGAVELEREAVLPPGRELGDGDVAARAVLVAEQDVGHVLRLDRAVDPFDVVAPAGEGLHRPGRDAARRVHRVQVGEDGGDALAGDEAGQIEPVGADVGDGAEHAALAGVEPPVPVGRLQQPVLDVDAVDAVDGTEVPAPDARASLSAERVEADVVVRAVDEPAVRGEPEQLAGLPRRERERLLADDVLARGEHRLDLVAALRRGRPR